MAPPRSFAVIGAGVAGLQAAAQLKQAGYDVTIFEKSGNVGGVWQSNYAGYRLQVRKWHYEIPGFPWTDKLSRADPRYPSGQEVQAYLERYAHDAGLLPLTRFNVNVHTVRPVSDGAPATPAATPGAAGWEVEWDDGKGAKSSQRFDYLVVATGLFNQPDRPEWAEGRVSEKPPPSGPWVVDAKAFTDASPAKGKRVVVVGGGKTAVDVGVATSKVAASATLVARRGHVIAPRHVLGFIPFEFASYTRWSWALQPAYYEAGPLKKGAHTLFRPIKAAAWGLFGLIFPLQTSTPGPLKPRHGLLQGIYDTVGIVDSAELSAAFKSGRLAAKAGRVRSLTDAGVELEDGTQLQADIVVLATGYKATARSLLPQQLQAPAGYKGDDHWLYKNVLPLGLSNLAYIGQNATFQHVLTTALQSRWLVDVLQGKIKLPPAEERAADVAAQEAWLARFDGVARNNNYVWAQHGKYHDALARDIAGRTFVHNPLAYVKNQAFAPLFPGNASLLKNGSSKAGAGLKAPPAGIPVSATQAGAAATA